MQGFLMVGLVTLGMVNCKAIQPEDDKVEMAEENCSEAMRGLGGDAFLGGRTVCQRGSWERRWFWK